MSRRWRGGREPALALSCVVGPKKSSKNQFVAARRSHRTGWQCSKFPYQHNTATLVSIRAPTAEIPTPLSLETQLANALRATRNMVQGVKIEQGHIVDTNPATGAVIQRVACPPSEIDAAVAAAGTRRSRPGTRPLQERTELVKQACAALAGKRQQLAKLITGEMGKALAESLEEVDDNVDLRHRRDTARRREIRTPAGRRQR